MPTRLLVLIDLVAIEDHGARRDEVILETLALKPVEGSYQWHGFVVVSLTVLRSDEDLPLLVACVPLGHLLCLCAWLVLGVGCH